MWVSFSFLVFLLDVGPMEFLEALPLGNSTIFFLVLLQGTDELMKLFRLCLVGLIWGNLLFKKMDLRGWRLFGWLNLGGWMRRDLQDWIFASKEICRDLKGWISKLQNNPCKWSENYKIPFWLWKLQNTLLSGFRVCNNKYYIWKINWFIPNFSNNWFQ